MPDKKPIHNPHDALFRGQQRFGPAPPALVQLIENARATEVDSWMRRILTAATLDDLLA